MNENQILGCERASSLPPPQPNPPDHILVVEDDADIRHMNVEALERAGYQVDDAEDGAAAWQTLNHQSYDLMITDQNMPKVSGLELLKKLHAIHMTLPTIMATGTLPTAEFARCPWLQPAATLLKPYTLEEMLRTVKKILSETEQRTDSSKLFLYREMPGGNNSPAPTPAMHQRQAVTNSTNHILVVDEDRDLRLLYSDVLAGGGYRVDFAEDGAAAWEMLQTEAYDLLITEHAIPKLTGVELIKKLRAARMALPVVMAAGRLPTQELTRDPVLQLAAMLWKPFTVDALLETVNEVLRLTPKTTLTAPSSNERSQPATISR